MSEFTPPGGEPSHPERPPDPWSNPYQPYGDTAAAFARARTSKKMAGWGLGLSLLLCLPFAPLVGLGLGIAVLVRARDGRDHGKGMAIGAVVIGGLYLLATVGLFAWGVVVGIQEELAGPERDDSGQVEEQEEMHVDDLRLGDCVLRMQLIEDIEPGEDATGMVTVVPCDETHLAEVYLIYQINPDDHSDQDALDQAAFEGCLPEYKAYVGRRYYGSQLELYFFNPTKGDPLEGERVVCLVGHLDGPHDEMLAGSRR